MDPYVSVRRRRRPAQSKLFIASPRAVITILFISSLAVASAYVQVRDNNGDFAINDGFGFCVSPLCTSCTNENADPQGPILGDYCASLVGILSRGSTNVQVQSGSSIASNSAAVPYLYIPPFENLAFNRAAMTLACSQSPEEQLEAQGIAYGISTSSLSLAVASAELVCQYTPNSLLNFFLNSEMTGNKVQVLGCDGYSYFGYTPQQINEINADDDLKNDTPFGGLRDCYTSEYFSNSALVPNLFSQADNIEPVAFPQGKPSLRSTVLKGISLLSASPVAAVQMFESLWPALQAMMIPGTGGAMNGAIEYPNSTNGKPIINRSQPGRAPKGRASSKSKRVDGSQSLRAPIDTFFPGPTVRTLTKTLQLPTTTEEEPTTTTETETATTTLTEETTTTTAETTTTQEETTEPPTTLTETTTTTTTTTTATTGTDVPPESTTQAPPFQNIVQIDSQVLLLNWANLLMQQSTAAIPPETYFDLQSIAAQIPDLLQPYLCQNVAGMQGLSSAIPRRLFVTAVGGPNDASQNIMNGYQATVDTVFDSYAQFSILAALGSKGLALTICKQSTQGTLAVDKLIAVLDYLAIRDPSQTVIGMAASNPTTGDIDLTKVDTVATSLAIIAIQQMLSDLEDTDNASPQRLEAQSYLDQLRTSTTMTSTNCMVNYAAFWPVSYNASFGGLMAMAGPASQCGGETPSLGSTALWIAAVSGSNPYRLVAGLHPVPQNNGASTEPWIQANRVLFLSVSGCIIGIVLAAVIALVVANVKRNRKVQRAEEERRALVNPQVIAGAAAAAGRTSEREKKNMGFF